MLAFLVAKMVKNLPAIQETWVEFLGWKDSLEKGNDNPLQYSCLENSMDRGAWWAIVHVDHKELDRTEIYLHHFTITLQRFRGSGGMV